MAAGSETTWVRGGRRLREASAVRVTNGASSGSGTSKTLPPRFVTEPDSMRVVDPACVSPKVILAHNTSPQWEREHYYSIERYRLLCARVFQVAKNLKTQVFLMASAIAEEGKTLTCANLAYAMSGVEGKRTLLLELDLRRPSLRFLMGLTPDPEEQLFLESKDWRKHLWQLRPNLHALIASRPSERPEEILYGDATRELIEQARQEYDYIFIDSAPLLLAVDSHVLLGQVDHALLVVRADHTPIACSQDALRALGDKALGCVLNDVKKIKYEEYYRSYYK